jgi:putative glutamine amidotransferase
MMKIGLTDNMGSERKLELYKEWLGSSGVPCSITTLSYLSGNTSELDSCGVLVLSGGSDVDPAFYGGPARHPSITGVDKQRDEFELHLLREAIAKKIPVLGICRGMQVMNVFLGGTLIPDLEEAGYPSHRSREEGTACLHSVGVEKESLLSAVAGTASGVVHSSHHQAVGIPGSGVAVSSRSADGVIEAIEVPGAAILGVQWHPERMTGTDPLSRRLLHFCFSGTIEKANIHN